MKVTFKKNRLCYIAENGFDIVVLEEKFSKEINTTKYCRVNAAQCDIRHYYGCEGCKHYVEEKKLVIDQEVVS